MTTKILTVRVPSPLYSTLCQGAGEQGVPISAYMRHIIEREQQADQIAGLRHELLARLNSLDGQRVQSSSINDEVLLLCRSIAAHLNPQLVAQVRVKLAKQS